MFGWFLRRKDSAISREDDSRVSKLQAEGITCVSCGKRHFGIFDLGFDRPSIWSDAMDLKPNRDDFLGGHFISDDLCVYHGKNYFVRCVLEIPILGLKKGRFGYGVWSSLSRQNFQSYVLNFDKGPQTNEGPWFGWFSNSLKGYPQTLELKCDVFPQANGNRPLIQLQQSDHPLFIEQQEGISIDRLFEIYRFNGHNLG
jgi:hypothetical protein